MSPGAVADPARLAAVRATGLLDTEAEEVFDRLTRLAVRLVGVPAAFLSLVDADRDFYKSACGFGEPLASARQLTGPTFCHHAIGAPAPLVIPDTAADPLYRDVPTVHTLGVAAYVGVPLVVGGQAVGSFCAIDTRPHAWTPDELEVLTELAASATREIELRGALHAAERAAARTDRLLALTATLAGARTVQEVADAVVAQGVAATRAATGMLAHRLPADGPAGHGDAREDAGATAVIVRAVGLPPAVTTAYARFPLTAPGPAARCLRTGEPQWVTGLGRDTLLARYPDAAGVWASMGVTAVATVPLVVGGADGTLTTVGAMSFAWAAPHPLPEEDRAFLLALGRQAAQALERARLADAERAAGVRAEAVLASIADAFYLLDRDWRFTYVNAAAEPLLLTTRDQLLGRTLWEAFPRVEGSPFAAAYREAMAAGRPAAAEAYFAPLGTWFDVRAYPWAGGLMVHFRDVGARKAAEADRERLVAELRAASAELTERTAAAEAAQRTAEAANRAKGEFLAVMSHELRTPLNAIGGYAELMELGIHGPVTEQQRADLGRIQRAQRHLLGLINGVLNYSRVEAGAVHYELADVPLDEVLATCEALVAPQVRARGLTLHHAPPAEPGLRVRADGEKLRQVVLNLLTNAVKFTEPGGRVGLAARRAGGVVRVTVADTGMGIAPGQLERIFEPFVQVDAALTRTREGVGLGLAISRDLARGMGGDLTAESAAGAGSTFTLTVPVA